MYKMDKEQRYTLQQKRSIAIILCLLSKGIQSIKTLNHYAATRN